MMKFKQGDKVKVVAVNSGLGSDEPELFLGETGVVIGYDGTDCYPYKILFDNVEIKDTDNNIWDEDELELVESKPAPNQFLYYNDTKRTVRIHPATKSHGTECDMSDIQAGEMRMFHLPEGTYAWTKMWDYGGEHGLSILVSPTPFTVEELKAKKNVDRIDEIIEMLKSPDGKIIDVFEALHNLKKWVN
ncbi:PsaE-like protein [Bacillus phage Kirov]|uniref:PsaE-like protein n=1 Tax=Bacillus phage Kirov TaxID=2783539 RepID=A0A7U3RWJ7_9CAUD|nr:PsaE-like protein [Bacillus phage Kirov]QOV08350.1 PsaE-like protein [Bacillus phage Kirov]